MYVLADLEWIENECHHISITQIAMIRVNENWQAIDRFYSRVRPLDFTFYRWDHMGCTGGTEKDFLSAPKVDTVTEMLRAWLREDDIVCFWCGDALQLLRAQFEQKMYPAGRVLKRRVCRFLCMSPCNPYLLGKQLNLPEEGTAHYAADDAEMIRRILEEIRFPQPIQDFKNPEDSHQGALNMPYVFHVDTNTVHKRDCPLLQISGRLKGYENLKKSVGKRYLPCTCLQAEYAQAKKDRNREIMERNGCQYFYTPNSNVFHRKNCRAILGANTILGVRHRKTCIAAGKQPCKLCRPMESDVKLTPPTPTQKNVKPILDTEEAKALKRQQRALEKHRAIAQNKTLSAEKRRDLQTLASPSFAFFAAKGYASFHLPNCKKMVGLSDLKGYSTCQEALRDGHTPCKQCRPSSKNDLNLILPLNSRRRKNDSAELWRRLCKKCGFRYTEEGSTLCMETPVGIWKLLCSKIPYSLMHINLAKEPGCTEFHRQPRIFLSLQDAFRYIYKHDKHLCHTCGRDFPTIDIDASFLEEAVV